VFVRHLFSFFSDVQAITEIFIGVKASYFKNVLNNHRLVDELVRNSRSLQLLRSVLIRFDLTRFFEQTLTIMCNADKGDVLL
jgi:hypothetical protein